MPRQQLSASFTPENRVPGLPPQPHSSGQHSGRAGLTPSSSRTPLYPRGPDPPAPAVHQQLLAHTLPPPSKDRNGDKAHSKCQGWDTAGLQEAADRQRLLPCPATGCPVLSSAPKSHSDRVKDTNMLVTSGPQCWGATLQAVMVGYSDGSSNPQPPTLTAFFSWLQKIPGFYPKMPPPSMRTPWPAPIATVP